MDKLIEFLSESIIAKITVVFCISLFMYILQSDPVKQAAPNMETVQSRDNVNLRNSEKPILEVHSGNLNLHEELDPLLFIDRAYSSKDETDLKSQVHYESNVDIHKSGEYQIIYTLQIGEIIAREKVTVLVD